VIESTKESMELANEARRDTAVDDEHDSEGATHALQFAESSALLKLSRHHLDLINAALSKMSRGIYGSCERCGVDIAMARLEARPFAPHCIRCAVAVGL
jgi:RNA polymerase-binding transcription factor DksA